MERSLDAASSLLHCKRDCIVFRKGYLHAQLSAVEGVTIYGPPPERRGSALAAFNVEGIHATDLSTFLDFEGRLSALLPSLSRWFSRAAKCMDIKVCKTVQGLVYVKQVRGTTLGCMSTRCTFVCVQGLLCGQGTTARSRCTTTWGSMPQPEPHRTSTTRWCAVQCPGQGQSWGYCCAVLRALAPWLSYF